MVLCLNCGSKTSNKKFCSISCASSYNNKKHIKRKKTNRCKECGDYIISKRKLCDKCFENKKFINSTINEVRGGTNSNKSSRYPYIRQVSRKTYINSGRPMSCFICGYSAHVDICHIKPIHKFRKTDTVEEINSISNLVALCKNHHWELDHGFIKLSIDEEHL